MISTLYSSIPSTIRKKFIDKFDREPLVVSSPGRVNLIGEHTDYNDGYVFPAAIDKVIVTAISERADGRIHLFSNDLNASYEGNLDLLESAKEGWPDYVLGVVAEFQKLGIEVKGFNLLFGGDIPMGAGMSSSAALECSVAFALDQLFQLNLSKLEMVEAAKKAENNFVGVNCGIMDQFASMFGKRDHAIRLDCRSLEYAYVPLRMDGLRIVLLDTNVKHSLASSEYNLRRQQCEQGVNMIQAQHRDVRSLRDVNTEMLDLHVLRQDPLVYARCRYVVDENQRVLSACDDLSKEDMVSFGEKMYRSHRGLSEMYAVSCAELDFLVEETRSQPAVLGARMMGGGFGGCTINLVREEGIEALVSTLSRKYQERFQKNMDSHLVSIGGGTEKYVEP